MPPLNGTLAATRLYPVLLWPMSLLSGRHGIKKNRHDAGGGVKYVAAAVKVRMARQKARASRHAEAAHHPATP